MKQFKIRCSAIGQIMGSMAGGITDIQLKKLTTLETKRDTEKGNTAKQQEELEMLLEKKDSPKTLPKGCVTYLENWFKENLYGFRQEIKSKYLDKGNQCEDDAISMLISNYGLGYNEKNEDSFENDYLTGTPDLIYPGEIFDTKCSYDPSTFPLFVNCDLKKHDSGYWWQGQGYMELCKIYKYSVVYALCDTPIQLVEMEVFHAIKNLKSDAKEEKKAQIMINHDFSNVNMKYKLKRFEFGYDQFAVEAIYERVRLCRQYIKDVLMECV